MKIIILSLNLFFIANIYAQIADINTHNIVKDSFVAKMNRQDFKGIYEMADQNFKSSFSEEQMVSFLSNYATLGTINSSSLLPKNTGNFEYRLQCKNKSMQLTLGVVDAKSFKGFGLDVYKLQPDRTRQVFWSGNPLKSSLDKVVQKAVKKYMSNKHVSGLSVGVIKEGKSYSYNFGEMKKKSLLRTNNKTIYELGSIAKVFTGTLLANAVLDGKLKLDDDIRKYLKGNFPNLQYNGNPIKIVHLANLTSRRPSMPTLEKLGGRSPLDENYSGNVDDKDIAEILIKVKLDTLPGTRREYSNFAVCLLGRILEKVYDMSYEQLLENKISKPYKMNQTKITLNQEELKDYAIGYAMDGTPNTYWKNDFLSPAGGIRSSVDDMLLFMHEQLNPKNKVTDLTHQLTFGTEKNGKGLLWGINRMKKKNQLLWSHDGSTNGFSSLILVFPEIKAGIVLLTNNGDYTDESFSEDIYTTIYDYLIK